MIHPTAIIADGAQVGDKCEIGAYCVIGRDVRLGARNILSNHVTIEGPSVIGEENKFFPGAVVGAAPQDLKYAGEPTTLTIGDRNIFRECVTANRGTPGGGGRTEIGSHCLFMAYAHIAHDCILGSHVIMANAATLAGHVHVGDHVTIGGLTPVQQFVRIGAHAFIGGATRVSQDIAPFIKMGGIPPVVLGANSIGLSRRGFLPGEVKLIERAVKLLFKSGLNTTQAIDTIRKDFSMEGGVKTLIEFAESATRGLFRG